MEFPLTAEALRAIVGRQAVYRGEQCEIVEFLEADMQIVLRCMETSKSIQPNSYGDAARVTPKICSIPVFVEDGSTPNPVLAMIKIKD